MYMPKRKVFKDGEKLLMLMWLNFELFNDTFEQFIEKFNCQVTTHKDTEHRVLLAEIHLGFWVEFYELDGKMVPGFKNILYRVGYMMPSKKLLHLIIQTYLREQALESVNSFKKGTNQAFLGMIWKK